MARPTGATGAVPSDASRGYPRARARTRAALLAAARQVMAERGAEGATIADIAARADVSPGTFYNHFGDIPAILDALVDDLVHELDEAMAQAFEREGSATERFVRGVDRILRVAEDDPAWALCVIRFETTVERMRDALHERAVSNLMSGVRIGVYAREIAVLPVSDLLIGTLITAGLSRVRGRATSADNAAVAEVLLRALGVTPAKARRAVAILDA